MPIGQLVVASVTAFVLAALWLFWSRRAVRVPGRLEAWCLVASAAAAALFGILY